MNIIAEHMLLQHDHLLCQSTCRCDISTNMKMIVRACAIFLAPCSTDIVKLTSRVKRSSCKQASFEANAALVMHVSKAEAAEVLTTSHYKLAIILQKAGLELRLC